MGAAEFLYRTVPGRVALKSLTAPAFSRAAGHVLDSRISAVAIPAFVKKNGIDLSDCPVRSYASFNDFFTRTLNPGSRPIDAEPSHLISPCDALLSAHKVNAESRFFIKGSPYALEDFLRNRELAETFDGGLALIFRLTVSDYHRYCFFDSGSLLCRVNIPGVLHTVRPIALEHYNIYKRNAREYSLLQTENFGTAVQAEVGALIVGKIANRRGMRCFRRGDEKGHFEFGGSTVVVLLRKGAANLSAEFSGAFDRELPVRMGQCIGATQNKNATESDAQLC